jgi:hypothetical protein
VKKEQPYKLVMQETVCHNKHNLPLSFPQLFLRGTEAVS